MKILMVNKFLHPNGGSETYIFKAGAGLQAQGHEVQYFGMEHEGRVVGNRVGAYTSNMDFHGGSVLAKLTYPLKTIYSAQARRKIRMVLEDFQPDICHLNNFNYQLTPSIILEIRKWEKESGHRCGIVWTAHDLQLVCPNHMCRNPGADENCEKCLGGHFLNCVRGRCIHGSLAKSAVGALEAYFWNAVGVYKQMDRIICCSEFLKKRLDTNPVLAQKTMAVHNFVDQPRQQAGQKEDYVLYFGRYSREKGVATLVQVAKELPDVRFIFAGSGPLEGILEGIPNIRNAGFQTGEALTRLIRQARFTVYPSECYENCPFSVMESQILGTPVLGAEIGGIPELIREGRTGELFESGNAQQLREKIRTLWNDGRKTAAYAAGCAGLDFADVQQYCHFLKDVYHEAHKRKLDR